MPPTQGDNEQQRFVDSLVSVLYFGLHTRPMQWVCRHALGEAGIQVIYRAAGIRSAISNLSAARKYRLLLTAGKRIALVYRGFLDLGDPVCAESVCTPTGGST